MTMSHRFGQSVQIEWCKRDTLWFGRSVQSNLAKSGKTLQRLLKQRLRIEYAHAANAAGACPPATANQKQELNCHTSFIAGAVSGGFQSTQVALGWLRWFSQRRRLRRSQHSPVEPGHVVGRPPVSRSSWPSHRPAHSGAPREGCRFHASSIPSVVRTT